MNKELAPVTKIAVFRGGKIRKTLHKNEWWFVINDVVQALTDTPNVKDYIRKMRIRDEELSKGWGQFVTPLSIATEGGPQTLNCANTEGMLRSEVVTFCHGLNLKKAPSCRHFGDN